MSMWTAIVVIVAITSIARVVRGQRLPRALRHTALEAQASSEALSREVTELRKRIEVIERIVTDNRDSHRLAEQIEALRER